jgi:LacI family transcriptional regulator
VSQRQQIVVEGNHTVRGGEIAMAQMLSVPDPPTAVLTSNDLTAMGAMRAISRTGLRVPEDISVVGFDDIELSEFMHPPLTTVRLSRNELGQKAFNTLYRGIEGGSRAGQAIKVSTDLVLRESTAAPNREGLRRR